MSACDGLSAGGGGVCISGLYYLLGMEAMVRVDGSWKWYGIP